MGKMPAHVQPRETSRTDARLTDAKLSLALEAAQLGWWQLDLQSHELVASPQCKANHGLSPDAELTLDGVLDAIDAGRRDEFSEALDRTDAERSIATSIGQTPSLPAYRIEQRSPTDYAIVFDSKPSVAVAGQLLTQLGGTQNVVSARIDEGAAADAPRN